MSDSNGWYWLDAPGLAWVRHHLPQARVERHRRVVFFDRGRKEVRNQEAVQFSRGGLTKARRAGVKPREAAVETVCGTCKRTYVPGFEHDPCIEDLPGVRFACCGHGTRDGYAVFDNGVTIRFSGPAAIERHSQDGSQNPRPGVEPDVKAAVEKAAAADRRTVASFVAKILVEYLEEHGYLKKPRKA